MKYAIEVLEKDQKYLEKCLSEWDLKNHPDARKLRSDKLKSLEKAISHLTSVQSFDESISGKS